VKLRRGAADVEEAPVDEAVDQTTFIANRDSRAFYRAALPLSSRTLTFVAGFGVGTTTAWRYVNETTDLPAARAPKVRQAVRDARRTGYAYVVLDGTLIPVDRIAADRPFYSGKHKAARDEPAGHRQSRRGHLVGVRCAARRGA